LALYYLETSALVKLYIRELGSARLLRLAARTNDHRFAVLVLSRVEFHSAIRRRQREGDVDTPLAQHLLSQFDQHMESKFIKQIMNEALIDVATGLVDRHALRAYDAVQLAGCIALKGNSGGDQPTFVSSDRRLVEAAEAEGLASLDPTVP
jgi:predicted nucleic acid-binding protein